MNRTFRFLLLPGLALLLSGCAAEPYFVIEPCRDLPEPHPEVAAFIRATPAGAADRQTAAIRAARGGDPAALEAIRRGRGGSPAAGSSELEIVDRSIAGPGGTLPIRLYRPLGRTTVLRPMVVYLHGGGWTIGSIRSCARYCRQLALVSGAIVIAPNYRLAPEHPWPAAADDALAVYRWAEQNAEKLGGDPRRISVGGDSAGGNLAIATAMRVRAARRGAPVAGLILFYPVTLAEADRSVSWRKCGTGYNLNADLMEEFNAAYAPTPEIRRRPEVSPLLDDDPAGLPPTLLITAQFDILHDQGRAFAEKLAAAGVPVRGCCFAGAAHLFITMPGMDTYFHRALKESSDFINRP